MEPVCAGRKGGAQALTAAMPTSGPHAHPTSQRHPGAPITSSYFLGSAARVCFYYFQVNGFNQCHKEDSLWSSCLTIGQNKYHLLPPHRPLE